MMRIAVITASLEDRAEQLAEAQASVAAQTYEPVAHLVEVTQGEHEAHVRNRLIERARDEYDCEWVAFLDDDDLLDHHHLATLVAAVQSADPEPDMVYPRCRLEVDGAPVPFPDRWRMRGWDSIEIQKHNWIPVTVLLRIATWELAGRFQPVRNEEWKMWQKFHALGVRVLFVDEETWTYRKSGRVQRA